ncbi:MAG: MarR family winged helix-turn-helix transcriptional regulator [Parvibaculales bacterium]
MNELKQKPTMPDNDKKQLTEAVELMFFAYRDFVADPDRLLTERNLGRAHHRALHFIGRDPGMSVTELLNILGITKQSLSRVLRELLVDGYVTQTISQNDRRKRLLTLSDKGHEFLENLITPQHQRFQKAITETDAATLTAWRSFMLHLLNSAIRQTVSTRFDEDQKTS